MQNPDEFKEKVTLAKQEIKDLETIALNTIDNKGKDERNFIELLSNQRRATTLNNLLGNDISNILENSDNIQEDFSNLIENFGKDLGIDIKVNYTDTKGMPLESKDKGGTARLDGADGKIYINTDKIKDTSDLVGTVFEELSHIIDGIAGRQDKEVAKTTDEKGLESLGRPINDYFKEQYLKNSKSIELKSEGDFTFASRENVGDSTALNFTLAGTIATVDDPLPFGDMIAGGILAYEFFKNISSMDYSKIRREMKKIGIHSQVGIGEIIETPDTNPEAFKKGKNDGKNGYENLEDGSWWEKDRAGTRGHGGSAWKRWPKKPKSNNNSKDRRTVGKDGKVIRE